MAGPQIHSPQTCAPCQLLCDAAPPIHRFHVRTLAVCREADSSLAKPENINQWVQINHVSDTYYICMILIGRWRMLRWSMESGASLT